MTANAPTVLILGIGNKFRGDDGAGLLAVEVLNSRTPSNVVVNPAGGDCTLLLDEWQAFDTVYVIDAVQLADTPGKVLRFDASEKKLPFKSVRSSTHAMSIGEAIELARNLGQLPKKIVVYGIVGENFSTGEEISKSVRTAVDSVCDSIIKELQIP